MVEYEVALIFIAVTLFGAIVLPRVVSGKPLSLPILYVGLGYLFFTLPTGIVAPDPIAQSEFTERLTELVVIISLMGAGLKLDRPFDWRAWVPTWRLLGIAMPLTVAIVGLLGWGVLRVLLPTAVLMGAVIAPTDPVLASDVQTGPPTDETDEEIDPTEQEGEIRFALTSEAGLNDGLAFPFTNLAIAMAAANLDSTAWLGEWVLVDVAYRIAVGVLMGYLVGKLVAYLIFSSPSTTELGRVMEGGEALAATLFAYGVTELLAGYGFIAVFVSALVLRHYEWTHAYYERLHDFAVLVERLLMAAVLVLFGGAIAGGLLAPLTWKTIAVGIAIVFVVRPFAGIVSLLGTSLLWRERAVIASFGIRGIGSFFYLSHALNQASFEELELLIEAPRLWALVGLVVLTSIVVHGVLASPVMNTLDLVREIGETEVDADTVQQ